MRNFGTREISRMSLFFRSQTLSLSEINSPDFEASGSATPTNVIAMAKKVGSRKTLILFHFELFKGGKQIVEPPIKTLTYDKSLTG